MSNVNGGKSPLAPPRLKTPGSIAGVGIAGARIGLKRSRGAKDLMVARLAPGTTVAGVLTRSRCPSAPVEWCRHILPRGQARALIVNSGNANAFTGEHGRDVVRRTTAAAARIFRCRRDQIYVASTGVIGLPVPPGHIAEALPRVAARVRANGWKAAAEAITTTDTFPKAAARTARIGDKTVTIGGVAKGSGMIAPDMATLLAFLFTDAKLAGPILRRILKGAVESSFGAITVDGDTSTSDTALLFATGRGPRHPSVATAADPLLRDFRRALGEVATDLAQQVVRDGEGASKFVTINVTGAESKRAARRIGLTIGNSPLVKTAIAGADANWGRIVMAVGKAGEKADRDRLAIAVGGVPITEGGCVRPGYDESPVAAHMRRSEIVIDVDVGVGRGRATVWTCDLTHGYIRINADYRS